MPSHVLLHDFIDQGYRSQLLAEVDQLSLQRYDNSFERKSFLPQEGKGELPATLAYVFGELRSQSMCIWAQRLLNVPIDYADFRHYGGLFVYGQGDYLEPHVDAGIHPMVQPSVRRKVATSLLYLTDAYLSFWRGDVCTDPNPEVWLQETHNIAAGSCVLFANTDTAWHSVPEVPSTSPGARRVVLTVSYMAPESWEHPRFRNPRTRAYFAKRHGKPDSPTMRELRELRASEDKHQTVYRLED